MSHRTTNIPPRPEMINGQQIPPARVHAGTSCSSSSNSTPSPATGNLSTNLNLKSSLGGGVAPHSNVTDNNNVHFPALSPRRQMITNGKPLFQIPQPPGLPTSQSLKPKQQEFGNSYTTSTVKGRIHGLNGLSFSFLFFHTQSWSY